MKGRRLIADTFNDQLLLRGNEEMGVGYNGSNLKICLLNFQYIIILAFHITLVQGHVMDLLGKISARTKSLAG